MTGVDSFVGVFWAATAPSTAGADLTAATLPSFSVGASIVGADSVDTGGAADRRFDGLSIDGPAAAAFPLCGSTIAEGVRLEKFGIELSCAPTEFTETPGKVTSGRLLEGLRPLPGACPSERGLSRVVEAAGAEFEVASPGV
ncbi:MAG TPA: hypothetical protein VH496_11280 [Mycobacterium sp.]|jgi:hypothetical protein